VKSTSPLSILSDFSVDESAVSIHPNDGFDLGLMTTEYEVLLYVGEDALDANLPAESFTPGRIFLKNQVRGGHIELGMKAAERLGSARQAKIVLEPGGSPQIARIAPA